MNRKLFSSIFRREGWNVVEATDGVEAVAIMEQLNFPVENQTYTLPLPECKVDLIFMDVMMPNMDGITATYRIRDMEESYRLVHPHLRIPFLPISALTAAAMKDDKERCLESGMNFYVTKPVERASLVKIAHQMKRMAETGPLTDSVSAHE